MQREQKPPPNPVNWTTCMLRLQVPSALRVPAAGCLKVHAAVLDSVCRGFRFVGRQAPTSEFPKVSLSKFTTLK